MSGKNVQAYLTAPPKALIRITETRPDRAGVYDGPLRAIGTALEARREDREDSIRDKIEDALKRIK